jgi:hypothetical protein
VVEESRKSGKILKVLDSTFLTLIPKELKYRYKISLKSTINRLKLVKDQLTSKEQGGYVGGWQILDGVIKIHEAIHTMKSSK